MAASRKRTLVFAPEGFHPVKVQKCGAMLAGDHVMLGNTGAGCAIDDVEGGDLASVQTRGLVSLAIVEDPEGTPQYAPIRVGDFLYAMKSAGGIQIIAKNPLSDPARGVAGGADAPKQALPWGIVLQREKKQYNGNMVMVRAFKFPGPFVVHRVI